MFNGSSVRMSGRRFATFLFMVLGIWGLVHAYVFWRLSSVPWIAGHVSHPVLVVSGILLWLSYLLARVAGSWQLDVL